MIGGMIEGAMAWYARYRDKFVAFGTFPGGGGFGAVDVDSVETVNQMLLEMPFSPLSHLDVRMYTPDGKGFEQARAAFAQMAPAR